ncbi:STAS domain-containing protein [Lentzea sp. NPDC058450]|uniref:STAS domain-containing protein n=1 Tax=Lentzea sp. NPDC058450 TaxID=3346505 RepID=UPI003656B167
MTIGSTAPETFFGHMTSRPGPTRRPGVLAVCGDIDIANCGPFAQAVSEALVRGVRTIDVGELTFFGAAAARALQNALQAIQHSGEVVTLDRVSSTVRLVLDVCGVADDPKVRIVEKDGQPQRRRDWLGEYP